MNKATKDKRLSSHGQYYTEYHICWITKYRYPVLIPAIKKYLNKLLPKILETMPGCETIESSIQPEHIHMVMVIPPKYSISEVVGRMKGISSSYLRKRFTSLAEVYSKDSTVWSPGYFVSTVGVGEEKILSYIRNQ